MIFSTPSARAQLVEAAEYLIEQRDDLIGTDRSGEWCERHDVGEQHRHVLEALGDHPRKPLETLHDLLGQNVQQQGIGLATLLLDELPLLLDGPLVVILHAHLSLDE